jgi:hypothetical protein
MFRYDAVVLRDLIPPKNNAEELRQSLLKYLQRIRNFDPEDSRADLDTLIAKARKWAKCD